MAVAIKWFDLGTLEYKESLRQQALFLANVSRLKEGVILLFELEKVLTLGKHAILEHVLWPEKKLQADQVSVVRSNRGGQVTAHMPGQIVCYPLLDLRSYLLGPKKLVQVLENAVVELLSQYGVESHVDQHFPGVWVGNEKICSIGLNVSKHLSSHGLALNIQNDLTLFDAIRPCGIEGRGVTSLQKLTNKSYILPELKKSLAELIIAGLKLHERMLH